MENNISDKELMKMIYLVVQNTQEKLTSIQSSINIIEGKQREIHITIHGDEDRNIKGLSHHIETLRKFMDKYKKWEFAIGLFVGFFGFVGACVIGVYEFIKQ